MKKDVILKTEILEKVVKELFTQARLPKRIIANELNVSISQIDKIVGNKDNYSDKMDIDLCNKILYDYDYPVSTEVIINSEKDRFEKYCAIEAKSLQIIMKLLDYYEKEPVGDIRIDKFKKDLAQGFLQATHNVRAELLQKYSIDKETKDGIDIHFIDNDQEYYE